LSKICATNPAISALSSKEDQTGYPASKAVLAQAGLTFEVTPLEPEFLGTFKNCLTGVEALLLLAACRRNSAFLSLAKSASRWQAPSELFFFATRERRPQPEYQTLSRLATGFAKKLRAWANARQAVESIVAHALLRAASALMPTA
jgi:hypothetical protein